jgi:hypothetical protein
MVIKIFNELNETNSTKVKEQILRKYEDFELLKKVVYLALSPRVKFYLRKIPEYTSKENMTLEEALESLSVLSSREKTGNDAIEHLKGILENLSVNDATVIERIIKKDLKIGLNESTVNKVWKKLIETTPYQGAIAYDKSKVQKLFTDPKGVMSQVKMDGRYANTIITESIVHESRSGEITYLSGALDDVFESFPMNVILNGELTIDGVNRYTSNGIIASVVSISKKMNNGEDVSKELDAFNEEYNLTFEEMLPKIKYTVWDCITLDEYLNAGSKRPYHERWEELQEMLKFVKTDRVRLVEYKMVKSPEEAMKHFQELLARGEEGTIVKGMSGIWKDGKPNYQIKIKLEIAVDLRIIGFNEGKKGTRLEGNLGSLICESECGILKTDPAGITDEMRKFIWDNRESLLNTYAEVKCKGVSVTENGYSLLHPVFGKLRDDKTSGDTLENILKIEEAAKSI